MLAFQIAATAAGRYAGHMPDLLCHTTTPCPAIERFTADAHLEADGSLALTFLISGDIGQILLPPPAPAVQTDNLWQHTCFECFARHASEDAYREFNLATSGAFAAYSFTDYRDGMKPLPLEAVPSIDAYAEGNQLTISARIPAGALPHHAMAALTAVIELQDGSRSYWSLRHAAGKPDFHHAESFVLPLLRTA